MARSDRPATQAPDPAAAVSGTGGAAPLGRTVFASSAARPVQILTTQPAQLLRHNISDEELEMLGATNRDGLSEALWGCVGAAIALLSPVAEALWKAYIETPSTGLTILHLFEVAAFIGTSSVAITISVVSSSRGKRAQGIISDIRGRQPQ
jgi:hypothetical protein